MSGFRNDTFDDRDREHIKYIGSWSSQGTWNASNVGRSGTLTSTNIINDTVTFTFPEPAIAFYYYGIPRCCGGLYGMCIDCDPDNPNFIQIDAVNATDDGRNPPICIITSLWLQAKRHSSDRFNTPSIHQIIIKNEPDIRFDGHSQLTVDGFVLEVPDPSAGSSPSSSSISSTSTSTSNAPSPSTSAAASSSPPVGSIVGGVFGAFAFLLAIIGLAFCFRIRRRPARETNHVAESGRPYPSFVQTFSPGISTAAPAIISPTADTVFTWGSSAATGTARPSSRQARQGHHALGAGHAEPQSVSSFSDATSSSRVGGWGSNFPSSPSVGFRRERDAGPAPVMEEEAEDRVLPPGYGDVFAPNRRVSTVAGPQQHGGAEVGAGSRRSTVSSASGGLSPVRRKM